MQPARRVVPGDPAVVAAGDRGHGAVRVPAGWDEFLYSLIFTSTSAAKTIPVAIAEFTGSNAVDFGLIAAGGVLASLPPVLITMFFQRYLLDGLSPAR